jgi:hypothetical protein
MSVVGKALDDAILYRWARIRFPKDEVLIGKGLPFDFSSAAKRMPARQDDEDPLEPELLCVAIGNDGHTHHESDVKVPSSEQREMLMRR